MKIQPNCLLISEPFMGDSYFERTVIWLFEHNENGSAGFIINKPIVNDDIFLTYKFNTANVLLGGGPVNEDIFYFVGKKFIKNASPIGNGYFLSTDPFGFIAQLMENKTLDNFIFKGYCGWDANQLNEEIENKNWLVTNWFKEIFEVETHLMWNLAIQSMGKEYAHYARAPKDVSLN